MKKIDIKPTLVLTLICLIVTALLAVTNHITAPIIAQNADAEGNAIRAELMPDAGGFDAYEGELSEGVTDVHIAKDKSGMVIMSSGTGLNGEIVVMTALDASGNVMGIQVREHQETPGIGTNAMEPDFLGNFIGNNTTEGVKVVSGATFSSRGMIEAVQRAEDQFAAMGGVQ